MFVSLIAVSPLYLAGAERAHILKYEDEAGAQRAVDSGAVASYITAHSADDDTLFVLGSESQLYILANRRPATYFTRPISAMIVQPATFERTMNELEAAPPRVFVDAARYPQDLEDAVHARTGYIDLKPTYRTRFDAFLAEHYGPPTTVEYAQIYVLR